jgi:hypothetical protein
MRVNARLALRGLAAFGALVLAAMLAGSAVAQPAPVRIVQGSDGTLYVVHGGSYWTLTPDQISDTDLAALAASGEIDSVLPNELLMAPAPEAPQAAPAPAAAQQPAPASAAPPPPPTAPPAPVASGPPQLTIGNPTEGSNVSAAGGRSYTITGSATDPSGSAGAIDSVEVWIFGERNANGATNLGSATILSDGSWSLTFVPTRFVSTHTNIYVYARSKVTGQESVASRGFNIVG